MRYATEELARFVVEFDREALPAATLVSVKRVLLDLIGAAAAGESSAAAVAARQWAVATLAGEGATLWFGGGAELSPYAATLCNSTAASALDIDDGHRGAMGHPGAGIIPAAVAVAEKVDACGSDLIAALVLGYEVALRIASARNPQQLDTVATGRWCGFGAAAAAARLQTATLSATAAALALAGGYAPGLAVARYSSVAENHLKEGIPWGSLSGVVALDMAHNGLRGPLDLLEHPAHFAVDKILAGLGSDFAIDQTYFKPYACCRWIHAALDALAEIMELAPLRAATIQQIEVHTFARALTLTNEVAPATLEGAQYSLPFCLALRLVAGAEALLPITGNWLQHGEVTALAARVSLLQDEEMEKHFPAATPARLVVRTADGIYEASCIHPRGDPANPLAPSELEQKFEVLTGRYAPEWRAQLLTTLQSIEEIKVRELGRLLATAR